MADEKKVKIKLGARPKSFKHTVSFPMVDGTVGCIEVTYKYRTRREFAGFIDDLQATAKTQADAYAAKAKAQLEQDGTVPMPTQKELLEFGLSGSVDFIMASVEGWNLDEKFDRTAVEQLADEVPAAIPSIMEAYRGAINEGRLGN
ncbi:phage tail assembly chaperone [Massilia agilis]|uniref:Phage tail assembly chaperone n=1 Tax=Massilia agilis TaxID=1811226 RepID=A0ABT2DC32_9BURK|nr:phage tail assembly chaperone [Massilia agilis]MCS0808688.1 phage tail assembly chaperone [Massilia agilis]